MWFDGAQRGNCGRCILMLMAADETRRRQIEQAAFVLEDKTAIFFPDVVITPPAMTGAPKRLASRSITAMAASSWALTIASTPGLRIPAFS